MWLRIAETVREHIVYNAAVTGLDFDTRTVTVADGQKYSAESVISTIPWMEFNHVSGLPDTIRDGISELKYSSVQIDYDPGNIDTEAQWIYCPAPELSYHRILVRHNFCTGSRGHWTETNPARKDTSKGAGLYSYQNKYAYPLNTVGKPDIMHKLLRFAKTKNVYGLGRWGEWEHYNSDAAVERAMMLADTIT